MIKNNHFKKTIKYMEFQEQKTQIMSMLRKGDRTKIAKEADTTPATVWAALKKGSIREMTEMEKKVWNVTVDFLTRKQKSEAAMESKADKLASKI